MTQWYETLFANYGRTYDKECFTQGTVGEVDFVERELEGDRSKRILDIACGTGRHAVELTKRGYQVTGFDLSEGQLRVAQEKAAEAGVTVELQQRDATEPHFNEEFDAALMFCGGAFPLMETDEKNYAILVHAAAALRPGGFPAASGRPPNAFLRTSSRRAWRRLLSAPTKASLCSPARR